MDKAFSVTGTTRGLVSSHIRRQATRRQVLEQRPVVLVRHSCSQVFEFVDMQRVVPQQISVVGRVVDIVA